MRLGLLICAAHLHGPIALMPSRQTHLRARESLLNLFFKTFIILLNVFFQPSTCYTQEFVHVSLRGTAKITNGSSETSDVISLTNVDVAGCNSQLYSRYIHHSAAKTDKDALECSGQAILRINLSHGLFSAVRIQLQYVKPRLWTFHMTDSSSAQGYGACSDQDDCGAQVQIFNRQLRIYAANKTGFQDAAIDGGNLLKIVDNVVTKQRPKLAVEMADDFLSWNQTASLSTNAKKHAALEDFMQSDFLFNWQQSSDTSSNDTPPKMLYIGFNRAVGQPSRCGYGLCSVGIYLQKQREKRDHCTDGSHRCDRNAFCRSSAHHRRKPAERQQGYRCICRPGFTGNGRECRDEDECKAENNCVHKCVNTEGSYRCACFRGFRLESNNHNCVDIDECALNNGNCQQECSNTIGSFYCHCRPGFKLAADGLSCLKQAAADSVCAALSCEQSCNPTLQQCYCRDGYTLASDGKACDQTCAVGNGECQHKCFDTRQGPVCSCHSGYHLAANGRSCKKSCTVSNGGCSQFCEEVNSENDKKLIVCSCRPGFMLDSDSHNCTDIDECAVENGGCQYSCRNLIGSFECSCPAGFMLQPDQRSCVDIDECEVNTTCDHDCHNTPGSFYCTCRPGYELFPGGRCADRNECSDTNTSRCAHSCRNLPGTYECTCPEAHSLHPNQKDCIASRFNCDQHSARPRSGRRKQRVPSNELLCKKESHENIACNLACNAADVEQWNHTEQQFEFACGMQTHRSRSKFCQAAGHGHQHQPYLTIFLRSRIKRTDSCPYANYNTFNIALSSEANVDSSDDLTSAAISSSCLFHTPICGFSFTCRKGQLDSLNSALPDMDMLTVELKLPVPVDAEADNEEQNDEKWAGIVGSTEEQFDQLHFVGDESLMVLLELLRSSINTALSSIGISLWRKHSADYVVRPVAMSETYPCTTQLGVQRKKCVSCSAGSFYSSKHSICLPCPYAHYQPLDGALSCIPCMTANAAATQQSAASHGGHSAGRKQKTECPGLCGPGYYSSNTYEPCEPCEIGFYQPDYGRTSCVSCGKNVQTAFVGSTSFSDCITSERCLPGQFYDADKAACQKCPKDSYQPKSEIDHCVQCPGDMVTDSAGSTSLNQCKSKKCGGIIGQDSGYLESPNFPSDYPASASCTWTIAPREGRRILVVIPEISLASDNCSDYLVMRKSRSPYSTPTFEACESRADPIAFIARSQKLWITFRSDEAGTTAKGFQIHYVTYDDNYHTLIEDIVKDSRLYTSEGHRKILQNSILLSALMEVIAEPQKYYKYANASQSIFPNSFVELLAPKVQQFFQLWKSAGSNDVDANRWFRKRRRK